MKKIVISFGLIVLTGCNKFISQKSDEGLESLSTIAGYQTMLENDIVTVKSTPGLGAGGCDDYTLSATVQQATTPAQLGIYSWDPSLYQGSTDDSWFRPYQAIYQCNLVLSGLDAVPHKSEADLNLYRTIRSMALVDRSFLFLCLEETYGMPWRSSSSGTDLGVPLRLNGNAKTTVVRSTVAAVFNQIQTDVKNALAWLPSAPQLESQNRPSKPAAWALLARAALIRQDYQAAKSYADSSLTQYHLLLNYDTVKGLTSHPFYAVGNPEVLFQCSAVAYPMLYNTATTVDSNLYNSYDSNDLRRTLFFGRSSTGTGVYFKGYYSFGHFVFSGMAVDEVYLIRAESKARLQDFGGALDDLNTLLVSRYRAGTYRPYNVMYTGDVLKLVLAERRKELLFRESRWSDLRRLSLEPGLSDTLKRILGSGIRLLPPNSASFTWQIPLSETGISNIQQNPQ